MRLEQVEEGVQVVSLKPVDLVKPPHTQQQTLKPMRVWTIYKLETAQPVHRLRGNPAIIGATLVTDTDNARLVAVVTIEQLLEEFALPGSLTVAQLDELNNALLTETRPAEPPEPENVDMLDMWRDEVRRDNTRLGFDDWVKARRGTFVFTVRLTVPFDKPREVLAGALEANIRSALEDCLDVGRIHENASGLDVVFAGVE